MIRQFEDGDDMRVRGAALFAVAMSAGKANAGAVAELQRIASVITYQLRSPNQCDGCRLGLPIEKGVHVHPEKTGWDRVHMGCTADRYTKQADGEPGSR